MKPRQPYRSPFWKPDLGEPSVSSGLASAPAQAPLPERQARPSPPPPRRPERATPEHANTYAQSDLALFGKLVDTVKRGPAARPAQEPAIPRPQSRATPDRRREPAARSEASNYTSRDLALFQSLQPPSSDRQPTVDAARHAPSPQLSASTPGYSQADLDAFDKLTRFGRFS